MSPKSSVRKPVVAGIQRQYYNLDHWSMMVGDIGCVQTLSVIPVLPGDSMELNLSGVFRLSPLRRNMYLDVKVDLMAFYVPHRHIYGDTDWTNFIKSGTDEAVTLGTDTLTAGLKPACLGMPLDTGGTVPRWITRGYIKIYNNYIKDPQDTAVDEAYWTTLAVASDIQLVGLSACHFKTMTTGTFVPTLTTADYRLALDGGEVNILQLAQLKGRLQSEQGRDVYGAQRYRDVMAFTWGTTPNSDADQRPTMLMRVTKWLSGYDVDGTDATTLGTWAGKGIAICDLKMPPKMFPEHGAVWIMALLRFPYVHVDETHFLAKKSQPTYKEIAGDPMLISREAPVDLNLNEVFVNAGSVSMGSLAYAQWYRCHPSTIHRNYKEVQGHPFIETVPSSRLNNLYIPAAFYDNVFSTTQQRHWQAQCYVGVDMKRFIPNVGESIFAGSNN